MPEVQVPYTLATDVSSPHKSPRFTQQAYTATQPQPLYNPLEQAVKGSSDLVLPRGKKAAAKRRWLGGSLQLHVTQTPMLCCFHEGSGVMGEMRESQRGG